MVIKLDNEYNIIEFCRVGGDPNAEGCCQVDNIPPDIADDIFSYRYIEGRFVKRADADAEHIAEAKRIKLEFISSTCHSIIESGIQVGGDHYSLTTNDQMNLSKLATQAAMAPQLPIFYHADGKLCRQYTPEEILMISQLCVNWVTYHTTYNNFVKAYIKSLSDFEKITAFNYGSRIEDDELDRQMEAIIETTQVTFTNIIEDPFDYESIYHPQREESIPMVDMNAYFTM